MFHRLAELVTAVLFGAPRPADDQSAVRLDGEPVHPAPTTRQFRLLTWR